MQSPRDLPLCSIFISELGSAVNRGTGTARHRLHHLTSSNLLGSTCWQTVFRRHMQYSQLLQT